jgi:branched-chain amino acid transport system substrate-binding protein
VGAVVSQTGAHAELAADYLKGLLLWREQVNQSGGLLGRRLELRVLDDNSRAVRARELYAELVREKVDLLIGPYGSAATLLAAGEAERARRVMVNGAGPSAVVHNRPGRYVFQTAVPYARYGLEVLRVAEAAEMRKLFIVARDDGASREMAEATRSAALAANGFTVSDIELYRPGTLDFATPVAKARAANADAWIAFGDVRDAAEMVKSFKRLDYAPRLFFANAASHPRFIALLGQDAEWSLGAVDFDPRIGDAARAFAKTFMGRFTVPPQFAAAEGYTAGEVLAAAIGAAGSLEQEKVRAALAKLELPTMFGEYRVNPDNGAQIGFQPVVVQIRLGRPEPGTPLLPYPQWNERAPIK